MRFKIGLAVGFAAGYWWASTTDEERRAKLDQTWSGVRDNPRLQRVTESVSRDARRLTDAVEQRVVSTADGAADAVAGTVEPDKGASSNSSTGSGSSTPQSKSA